LNSDSTEPTDWFTKIASTKQTKLAAQIGFLYNAAPLRRCQTSGITGQNA
jgi:hypothetical protein